MKKTDLFKLMLVFAVLLLASAWNNTFAQENKAGNAIRQDKNSGNGAVVRDNAQNGKVENQALSPDEMKMKMYQEDLAKKAAIAKQQREAENNETAKKQADLDKKMQIMRDNEAAKKNSTPAAPISGLVEVSYVDQNNTANEPVIAYMAAYNNDASNIIASATNYDDAKDQLNTLKDKHVAALTGTLSAQDANDVILKAFNTQVQKLQQKLNNK